MAETMPPRIGHPRYLVEWYSSDLTGESVPALVAALEGAATGVDSEVTLLVTMGVPSDEVLYALFAAASEDVVIDVCELAGHPPQRITANVDARFRMEAEVEAEAVG